jgi:transcriptional regulator with XRE-family HTH domain
MYIAERLRLLREAKQLSRGDIEVRTGLLRCYISRVENGHTVPSIETLEKISRVLEVYFTNSSLKVKNCPRIRNFPKTVSRTGLHGEKEKDCLLSCEMRSVPQAKLIRAYCFILLRSWRRRI